MQKRFLLLQEVCIEKTLFNQAFLIYVDCNGQEADELERLGPASWRKATRCEEQPQEGKTSVILNQNYD